MKQFMKVASTNELSPGQCKVAQAGAKTVALYNVEGKLYALDNTCLHRGGPLGEGSITGTVVTCPWHGWQYDVTNGKCMANPSMAVATFSLKVEGDSIMVEV